jgi:glycosyltransferase involved in cell wall biosynthesis
MKVLFVGYNLFSNRPEAVSNIVEGLVKELLKNNVSVVVVTNSGKKDLIKKDGNLTLYRVYIKDGISGFLLGLIKFCRYLSRIVKKEKPNLIHDYFVIPGATGLITLIARNNTPVIKSMLNIPVGFGDMPVFIKGMNINYLFEELIFRIVFHNKLVVNKVLKLSDIVVTHNRFEVDKIEQYTNTKKVYYLPLGIDKDLIKHGNFSYHKMFGKDRSKKVLLYLGHPSVKKGIDDIFKSAKTLLNQDDSYLFLFCFSNIAESKSKYSKEIIILRDRYPNNIYYKFGYVNKSELYKHVDLLLLPLKHEWSSTSPTYSLLEANYLKLPFITSDLDLCREFVSNKMERYLINANSTRSLTEKIRLYFKEKPHCDHRKDYLWKGVVDKYIDLYEKTG